MSVVQNLATMMARNWWVVLLRGLVAIFFGVLTWAKPGISLAALVLVFGGFALADGVLALWAAVTGRRHHEDWWVLLLEGLVGIGIGLLTFFAPGLTALAILFYIAVWAIARGVLVILTAIRLRHVIRGELWLMLAGLASVVLGILLMARPGEGALALLWLIAGYAVVFGVLLVMLAFRLRGWGQQAGGARA